MSDNTNNLKIEWIYSRSFRDITVFNADLFHGEMDFLSDSNVKVLEKPLSDVTVIKQF